MAIKYLDNMTRLNASEISGFNMNKRDIQSDGSIRRVKITIAPIQPEDKKLTTSLMHD